MSNSLINIEGEKNMTNQGYVYILSNISMPGLLKIGMTRLDPTKRVKELSSSTGVPTPFNLVYYREFNDCVAAEFEIHSILAAKGLRYNDQREFFTIDTTDAINVLLGLKDSDVIIEDTISNSELKNFNDDIDLVLFTASLENKIKKYKESDFYKSGEEFHKNNIYNRRDKIPNEIMAEYKCYIDNGLFSHVVPFSILMHCFEMDSQIELILEYAKKGYVSGYIDVIEIYLESIDGLDNVSTEKKVWIANMLDLFAKNYRYTSEGDIYIDQKVPLYCGISFALGLQYDKNFYRILDLDDIYAFQEYSLWGYQSDIDERGDKLTEQLRVEKDKYLGTSCQLKKQIIDSERYKQFHSDEGEGAFHRGCMYAYGINGHEKDSDKAISLWKEAIGYNCKKAYLNLLAHKYNDDAFFSLANKGALDSCPQCLLESACRILNDIVCEEDINNQIKKRINRFLDLFIAQIDLAFYVDYYSCLNAIKVYIVISTAFQRSINKSKLREILVKIRAISDDDLESYYTEMSDCNYFPFADIELIEQEASLIMKELLGI